MATSHRGTAGTWKSFNGWSRATMDWHVQRTCEPKDFWHAPYWNCINKKALIWTVSDTSAIYTNIVIMDIKCFIRCAKIILIASLILHLLLFKYVCLLSYSIIFSASECCEFGTTSYHVASKVHVVITSCLYHCYCCNVS